MESREALAKVAAPLMVLALSVGAAACGNKAESLRPADQTTEVDPGACAPTWELKEIDHGDNHRWFGDGVQAIGAAHEAPEGEQKEAALEAAYTWFNEAKTDPDIYAGVLAFFNDAQGMDEAKGVTAADLIDADDPNCASEKASALSLQFEAFIAMADIDVATAPADGINSGTDAEGNVTRASGQGVYGDDESRAAISFTYTTQNGDICTKYVMERCGQIVITTDCETPDVPEGPTEVCPPGYEDFEDRCVHPAADGPPAGANQPPYPRPGTPGYPGRGEEVIDNQNGDPTNLDPTHDGTEAGGPGTSPGGGDGSVVSKPGDGAANNPDYQPGTGSPGTNEGTSDPEDTEGSDQTNDGDPGFPGL